ncbi:E3 ubiquitin-protein ligase HERC2-like [Oryza brachyantha]|uniref:RCC1-like domain-containing protein n=1 Tax=Oryza brachyantha TaxID=4533 RepID=J3LYZ7_ORYBR|nr:E3 ubiquitin-protein ligase HERC2-like [Oryza brachyantha]
MQCPMDATASKVSRVIQFHDIGSEVTSDSSSTPHPAEERLQRRCLRNEAAGEFPLAANPSILLHVFSSCDLDPKDLAALEATCKFFRKPASFSPDLSLPLPEIAAYDMCQKRAMFKMKQEEKELLKQRCGGSWKNVLRYILVGEKNYRREKSQVVAGPGHSIVVTTNGEVYSFGSNCSGQLGHGDTEDKFKPCLIRSLQGIRITQVAVGSRRTMLVSNTGSVYMFGHDIFGGLDISGTADVNYTSTPKLVESLKGIFVVQASIGGYFSAVLSREGRVYTFSWGRAERLGHSSDLIDVEPRIISGQPLDDVLVVQIAAGNCYLLMLAYHPTGMSVYSVGCGLGGKLGHGNKNNEGIPQMIGHFQAFNICPMSISAGAWHAAVLSCDGRVFTWGWGNNGCLGHGGEEFFTLPTAVEGLSNVKAVHVSAGEYTTFVVADNGDVYSFGLGESFNLGFQESAAVEYEESLSFLTPKFVASLVNLNEKFVQISPSNTWDWLNEGMSHTIALTESGKLYTFGGGIKGQLGFKLAEDEDTMATPVCVSIDDPL